MSRRKNKRKKTVQPQMGGYKKFLIDLCEAITLSKIEDDLTLFSNADKHMMYDCRMRITNPTATNAYVSCDELKKIELKAKEHYKGQTIKIFYTKMSVYQMMLMHCNISAKYRLLKKIYQSETHPAVVKAKGISDQYFNTYFSNLVLNYFKAIIQLGNPDFKYFGLNLRLAAIYKKNPCAEIKPEIYATPAQKHVFTTNGLPRPAFRLGKPIDGKPTEWIKVKSSLLCDLYNGDVSLLDLYIQSHALKRMKQRLDLLDRPAINYTLWENTCNIRSFIQHKGYLLLPIKLYDIKVGYLLADVIDDKLLFKTFLFVTHNFTPEGDKLRKVSGLGKEDISYWKIDRLSTFVNMDENKYPKLADLFKQAGLEDLFHLKEKDFDVDQMQSANLNGLRNYINKGRNAHKVQEEEFKELLQNA